MSEHRAPIIESLDEEEIPIDNLFLDPNNLRLSGIRRPTSERRYFEESVQRSVFEAMKRYDIDSLKKSFLHVLLFSSI